MNMHINNKSFHKLLKMKNWQASQSEAVVAPYPNWGNDAYDYKLDDLIGDW